MARLFDPHFQAVNASGLPLSGAKLFFYQAQTTTLITVYQDSAETTPHANPVIADASGLFPPIYVTSVRYKIVLQTSAGVTVQTVDNIDARARDFVSVKDFGAKGDGVTDDTAAFQAATSAAMSMHSGEIYVPAGDYIVKGWSIDSSAETVRFAGRLNVRGAGSHSTLITCKDFAGTALSVLGPSSQPESYFQMEGIRFLGNLVTGSKGVNVDIAAFMKWEDVVIEGFDLGLQCRNVEQCLFTRISSSWNNYGANFLPSDATTDPNSITFLECAIGANNHGGLQIENCNALTVINGSFQYNGEIGGGPYDFGVKLINVGSGYGNVVFLGTIWEGNGGDADLYLYQATNPSIVTVEGGSFIRASGSAPYAVNNILVSGAATDQIVRVSGTTFRHFGTYTPSAARRNIAKSNPSAKIISDNNYFQSAVEAPAPGVVQFSGSYLTGSTVYDPPSLADGGGAYHDFAVTGAALGDPVLASFSQSVNGITVTGYVSAANTVTAVFANTTGGAIDLPSGTLKAVVFKV